MPAATYDVLIEQGATFRLPFVYGFRTGATDPATGAPVVAPYDLTGCKARMHVRSSVNSETPLLEASSDTGGITLEPTAGKITVTLTDEQTATLTGRRAVYDLEVEYPSGDVKRVLQGKVTISAEVTR